MTFQIGDRVTTSAFDFLCGLVGVIVCLVPADEEYSAGYDVLFTDLPPDKADDGIDAMIVLSADMLSPA